MARRTKAISGVVLVLAVLAGGWWVLSRGAPSEDLIRPETWSAAKPDSIASPIHSTGRLRPRRERAAVQLPPPDAPLATVFEELATAADSGDVGAACRLAWDLQRCQRHAARSNIPRFLVEGAARESPGSAEEATLIAEVAVAEERLAQDKTICAGLSDDTLGQAASRMLQAAQLEHAPSQAMFAMWPPFGRELTLDEAELATFHRDHAMDFLRRAAASGEPAALLGLFHACHMGEIRLMHGTVDVGRDHACAMATAMALVRFADPHTVSDAQEVIRESAAMLDGEGRQRAQARARFYAERFERYAHYDFAGGVFKPQWQAPCGDPG